MMKESCLWTNICNIVVECFKINHSVYQCAHFYDNYNMSPCVPTEYCCG